MQTGKGWEHCIGTVTDNNIFTLRLRFDLRGNDVIPFNGQPIKIRDYQEKMRFYFNDHKRESIAESC